MNRMKIFESTEIKSVDTLFNEWMSINGSEIALVSVNNINANILSVRYDTDTDFVERMPYIEPGTYMVDMIHEVLIYLNGYGIDVTYTVHNFQGFNKFVKCMDDHRFLLHCDGIKFYKITGSIPNTHPMSRFISNDIEIDEDEYLLIDDVIKDKFITLNNLIYKSLPNGVYIYKRKFESYGMYYSQNNRDYSKLIDMDTIGSLVHPKYSDLANTKGVGLAYADGKFGIIT